MIPIQGKKHKWAVDFDASQATVDSMRNDGIEVFVVENSVPLWAVELGLTRIWCFVQDVWNLKNPWG